MNPKKVMFWALVFICLFGLVALLSGCTTKITYGDFSYEKPIWSSQEIAHLKVWIDPTDPTKILCFEMDGQKSDSQAAMAIVKEITSGVAGFALAKNPIPVN